MLSTRRIAFVLAALLMATAPLLGCERSPDDVEQWRNAQDGMDKMIEWASSPDEPMKVRQRAVQVLVEEDKTSKLPDLFEQVEDEEARQKLVQAAVQTIQTMWDEQDQPTMADQKGKRGVKVSTSKTVQAKDAAYFLEPYAQGPTQKKLQSILADWLSKEWQLRDQLGKTNLSQLIPRAGAKGKKNAVKWLRETDFPSKVTTKLMREADDEMKAEIATVLAKRAEKVHPKVPPALQKAIFKVQHDNLVPYLEKAATDPKTPATLVDGAMEMIKEIRGAPATSFFVKLIKDHKGTVRWAAVNEIIALRGKSGISSAATALPLEKETYAYPEDNSFQKDARWFGNFVVETMNEADVNTISDQLVLMLDSGRWPAQILALATIDRAWAYSQQDENNNLLDPGNEEVVEAMKKITSSRETIPGWGSQMRVGELAHKILDQVDS